MIGFRQADARYPFLWEDAAQPEGRWHAAGDGPAHYFADTPHGAWAEFLRHEEITDADDLATIRRQIWAVDIGDTPAEAVHLPADVLTGGLDTYPRCQATARQLRAGGVRRLVAPSAALISGGAAGVVVEGGPHAAAPQDGRVVVIFGPPRDIVGWIVAGDAHPTEDVLARVRHF